MMTQATLRGLIQEEKWGDLFDMWDDGIGPFQVHRVEGRDGDMYYGCLTQIRHTASQYDEVPEVEALRESISHFDLPNLDRLMPDEDDPWDPWERVERPKEEEAQEVMEALKADPERHAREYFEAFEIIVDKLEEMNNDR